MGNTNTTHLDIESYFEPSPFPETKDKFNITIYLPNKAKTNNGDEIDSVTCCFVPGGSDLTLCANMDKQERQKQRENGVYDLEFSPKTHMRDFEVMDPFTPNELKIARGQGICVIIVQPIQSYLKLYYNKNSDSGVSVTNYARWTSSKETEKELLGRDLAIGYDVMIVTKEETFVSLCEPNDERDTKPTKIYFKHLESMKKYDPDNNSEEENTETKPKKQKLSCVS